MKVCLITPTSLLEMYASQCRTHLVLAQIDDPTYIKFYKHMRARHDTLILDNGAYEGKLVSDERLLQMTQVYDPDIVVLPDLIGETARRNMKRGLAFFKKHPDITREYMFLPHGDTVREILTACFEMMDQGVEWIGLPRNTYKRITYIDTVRVRSTLIEAILSVRPDTKIHAFGQFGPDPLIEAKYLNEVGCKSIDTAGPVWRGVCNCIYGEYWGDIPMNIDFTPEPALAGYQKDAILQNINAFFTVAGGGK